MLPGELAAGEQVAAVGGEVHVVDATHGTVQRLVQRHRVRIAEVEPLQALGDDDRVAPVGREVQVVRVVDRDRLARGLPVRGSIGVRLLPTSLSTQSVFRSHDGVTCCGSAPTAKCSTILKVCGSITSTVLLSLFGT